MKKLSPSRLKNLSLTQLISIGIIVVLLAIGIVGYTKFKNIQDEFKTVYDPEKAEEQALSWAEKVGKIYQLPDETPTIATVTEKGQLPQDAFYAQAVEGDKILLFPNSLKIILYRPSKNMVIDVGSLEPNIPQNVEVAGTSTEASPSAENPLETEELPQEQPQTPNVIFQQVEE